MKGKLFVLTRIIFCTTLLDTGTGGNWCRFPSYLEVALLTGGFAVCGLA